LIEYREGSAADRDAVLALRRRCFPDDDLEKQDPRFWDWEFGGGRLFLTTSGGRAVAHIGFVPQTYAVGGETVRGALAVDAMTDPEFRRQGIFRTLMGVAREAIRGDYALSTAWQIRKTVLPAMRANGWEPVLWAPVLAKPLLFARGDGGSSAPRPHRSLATLGMTIRGVQDLRWRYEENPLWKYEIATTTGARIVTRRTTLKGFDTLAIADLAWTDRGGAKALLRQACARGKAAGATLAAALVTLRHPALPLFLGAGFLPTPHRFRLLVNVFDPNLTPRVTRGRWALLWGDTDHL
jgi:GNAT superfamily N-acetyltransferase